MGLALKMIITSETSKHLTNLILEMYKQRCLLSWELASKCVQHFLGSAYYPDLSINHSVITWPYGAVF